MYFNFIFSGCGHCKKAKPEFTAAADAFKDDSKVAFAAVDCTTQQAVCSAYNVKGYPTIKVFHYLNKEPVVDYTGGRTENDFISYMKKFSPKTDTEQVAGLLTSFCNSHINLVFSY